MYKLTVNSITKEHSQVDNADYLDVNVVITDDKETVVFDARHGFPLDISKEQFQLELQKILSTFTQDQEQLKINAEHEAKQANADDLISSFVGKEYVLEDQINTQEPVAELPSELSVDNVPPVILEGETNV